MQVRLGFDIPNVTMGENCNISHSVVWNVVNEVDPCVKKQGTDYKVQNKVDTQGYQTRDKRDKKGDKWTLWKLG